ncbi:hypothetical protein [Vibrio furnissii]|uniref:hypothetical protein n=1 Tax=Vibrio furnissii TaxID=29494 RepID=UPI001EEB3494|nr:hypothetical protein [Vibrio furnissii]
MEKAEFIQKHLIEKGVPADLTKPTAFIWSRYKDPSQSLQFFNLLQKYSLHMAYLWGYYGEL